MPPLGATDFFGRYGSGVHLMRGWGCVYKLCDASGSRCRLVRDRRDHQQRKGVRDGWHDYGFPGPPCTEPDHGGIT